MVEALTSVHVMVRYAFAVVLDALTSTSDDIDLKTRMDAAKFVI
jgi:hypothetical protein